MQRRQQENTDNASPSSSASTRKKVGQFSSRNSLSKCSDCIIILIIYIAGFLLESKIAIPAQQYIPGSNDNTQTNFSFDYPNRNHSVPDGLLMTISILPWYILFALNLLIFYQVDKKFIFKSWLRNFYLMNRIIHFSGSLNLLVTNIVKYFVGAPRPYFNKVYEEHSNGEIDSSELNEAKLSFVSGHASIAMSFLFLLSLMFYSSFTYIQKMYYKKQMAFISMSSDNPHSYYLMPIWLLLKNIPLLSILLVFIPCYFGIWCGLTRITDYKHFAVDVLGGMIVGICCALLSYLFYWNETYLFFNTKLNQLNNEDQKEEMSLVID